MTSSSAWSVFHAHDTILKTVQTAQNINKVSVNSTIATGRNLIVCQKNYVVIK